MSLSLGSTSLTTSLLPSRSKMIFHLLTLFPLLPLTLALLVAVDYSTLILVVVNSSIRTLIVESSNRPSVVESSSEASVIKSLSTQLSAVFCLTTHHQPLTSC